MLKGSLQNEDSICIEEKRDVGLRLATQRRSVTDDGHGLAGLIHYTNGWMG